MSRVRYRRYDHVLRFARNLRNNTTPSEEQLWVFLRKKNTGFKFLRQHPVFYSIINNNPEFFIPDFYCAELRLIIEVDGPIHIARQEYDIERDRKLESRGFEVLRIRNEELSNFTAVTYKITTCISNRIQNLKT